ncbi:hypothetical protein NEOLEDRAFT_121846 [Neolentinus lepideus HHB14362 ss-1]|uniref:TPR-like protein n=1 Tax=Neolentinus lepideus HHB14362 ss-1 TaxID=1314782 RepID=A0A165MSF3_9AGAM|nr:hypothetical protein NEOLEDRAFT_121846 [Neolentinus lepideus HHB14362 ss-1]
MRTVTTVESPVAVAETEEPEVVIEQKTFQSELEDTIQIVEPAESSDIPPPPPGIPKNPYLPEYVLDDIPGIRYALDLFLASHMLESEKYCDQCDPKKERLYFATGYGLIQCVKGLMSFENEDLLAALGHTKHGNAVASRHRKKSASVATRLAGLVVSSLNTSGVGYYKSMTAVERHAELVYAESLFEKAILGIVYSGDWLAFIKEALNMRTTINIYRQLGKYLEAVDTEAGGHDASIDADFRTGVYLGVGMSNLVLSMMPGRLLTIVELFGYKGDRQTGLEYLMKSGGWTKESPEPSVPTEKEGLRRSICDAALLVFHLVLSSFTFEGVDIEMAQKILDWNLIRYPNGILFLFGAGRLNLCRSRPRQAIEYYEKAMQAQSQYYNLHQVSYWEMAVANLCLWDVEASLKCWRTLLKSSTWSKACYTYGVAVCLLQLGGEANKKEATALLEKVPALRQRIAGKSLPLEKFVERKARKYKSQSGRLLLPALEFAYVFLCIAHAPRLVLAKKILPMVEESLKDLQEHERDPSKYGVGYWDDLCLAKFLEGVCLRYSAYPDPDAILDDTESSTDLTQEEAENRSKAAFAAVFENGPRIQLDHYLVFYSHFELGRLLLCAGDKAGAKYHFELVLSGKPLEVNASGKKGKYSLESNLHVRANAALDAVDKRSKL